MIACRFHSDWKSFYFAFCLPKAAVSYAKKMFPIWLRCSLKFKAYDWPVQSEAWSPISTMHIPQNNENSVRAIQILLPLSPLPPFHLPPPSSGHFSLPFEQGLGCHTTKIVEIVQYTAVLWVLAYFEISNWFFVTQTEVKIHVSIFYIYIDNYSRPLTHALGWNAWTGWVIFPNQWAFPRAYFICKKLLCRCVAKFECKFNQFN